MFAHFPHCIRRHDGLFLNKKVCSKFMRVKDDRNGAQNMKLNLVDGVPKRCSSVRQECHDGIPSHSFRLEKVFFFPTHDCVCFSEIGRSSGGFFYGGLPFICP